MAKIEGYEDLSKKLSALGASAGGQALRSSAMAAMLPALKAAQAAIPVADPPYHEGSGVRHNADGSVSYNRSGTVRTVDPYPKKTFLGRLVTPGFAKRSLRRRAALSRDKTTVTVLLGVLAEAYYVVRFIELGTRYIAKRPWLEPSFHGASSEVGETLAQKLRQRLDNAAETGVPDHSPDPEAAD